MASVELETLEEGILRITLNRPERLNAIDGGLIDGMDAALDALADPHGPYRAGILTAAGRGFCAGADLSPSALEWVKPRASAVKTQYDMQLRLTDQMTRLYELPTPVIAAVNGVAVGGGLAYVLHCDVRVAAQEARFGSAFIKAGLSSMDMGISYLLPKVVGAGRARELMLSGRIIESDEAYRIGLVHEVVPQDQLLEAALRVARSFTTNNPFGVWQTKIGLNAALDAPSLRYAKEIENRTQVLTGLTCNPQEATAARMEKRTPGWDPL
jgi:enoyl-CoA hydratase/carnithine racemase